MTRNSGLTAEDLYGMFAASQFWPAEQLRGYQYSQLEQLVRHARSKVPFYEHRLAPLFRPNGTIDWSRWRDVPVFSRAEAASQSGAMLATELPPGHGPVSTVSTSGSTGHPLEVNYPRLMTPVVRANDWRAHRWWELDWSNTQIQWHSYNEVMQSRGPLYNYGPWGPQDHQAALLGKSYVAEMTSTTNDRMQHIEDVGGNYVFAQGSSVYATALDTLRQGQHHVFDAACSHGVTLEPEYESAIFQAFGAKFNAMYSSKEGGRIAHSCRACGNYHVAAESVFVEILRADGEPCQPGESGEVVITNLFNTAQPFIRYSQGDIASWAVHTDCAVTLPTLGRVDGRSYQLFQRLNGEIYMPLIPDPLREQLGAMFWQFVQFAPGKVEVRYRPEGLPDVAREQAFRNTVRAALNDDCEVTFLRIEDLPLTPKGKFLKYVNLSGSR